jgi:hypothetical protein
MSGFDDAFLTPRTARPARCRGAHDLLSTGRRIR